MKRNSKVAVTKLVVTVLVAIVLLVIYWPNG
jgi:hypothetical protein